MITNSYNLEFLFTIYSKNTVMKKGYELNVNIRMQLLNVERKQNCIKNKILYTSWLVMTVKVFGKGLKPWKGALMLTIAIMFLVNLIIMTYVKILRIIL